MTVHLVLTVRLHDARYHGVSEWPPAPARLFQALIAGVAHGSSIPEGVQRALSWLEQQPPPLVAAPYARRARPVTLFVPNNDLDSIGGDLSLVEKIRSQKLIAPRLLTDGVPFLYAWQVEGGAHFFEEVRVAAEKLYQFGRGVDMAWGSAELMSEESFACLLETYPGTVYRPSTGGEGTLLACPMPGSLQSLEDRYRATLQRLRQTIGEGRAATHLFVQPPKARFVQVPYGCPAPNRVFELVHAGRDMPYTWRLREVVGLVERIRDAAVHRLCGAIPERAAEIRGAIVGRRPGEPAVVEAEQRVRILPLPSIGHEYADLAIRRVLVEVPPGCPLAAEDVFWAFSGQTFDAATGELGSFTLVPADADSMRFRYQATSRLFQSVTPIALPETAKRRRIDSARTHDDAKPASERIEEEVRAISAVRVALRHAGIRVRPSNIHVQREPFGGRGARAEWFASGTRFEKERLWHVELEFAEPVQGPMVIGDGRFLGLGLLEPKEQRPAVYAFVIDESSAGEKVDPLGMARAFRRAVMARAQEAWGRGQLPPFFSGHGTNGHAAQREESSHLHFQYDPRGRLLVIAPHLVERREATREELSNLAILDDALREFRELRAGRIGVLRLKAVPVRTDSDPLTARGRRWVSVTPYALNRHPKRGQLPSETMSAEICAACASLGLPRPRVKIRRVSGMPGVGVQGVVQLEFSVAIRGPLVFGRTRHVGGGLFLGVK